MHLRELIVAIMCVFKYSYADIYTVQIGASNK